MAESKQRQTVQRTSTPSLLDVTWSIIAFAAVLAFVLGPLGFKIALDSQGKSYSPGEWYYRTLQLFVMNWDPLGGDVPWQLEIARFAAPVAAFATAILAIVQLFRKRMRDEWALRASGHTVVCGHGSRIVEIVARLRGRSETVTVVTDDKRIDLAACEALGAAVMVGPPDDPQMLARARAGYARQVFALSSSDSVNVATALQALGLARGRQGDSLRCAARVKRPDLRDYVRRHSLFTPADDPFAFELFNPYEFAALMMMFEYPGLYDGQRPTRILIIGFGQLGSSLLRRLVRDWKVDAPPDPAAVRVVVVERQAADRLNRWKRRFPLLAKSFDIDSRELNESFSDFAAANEFDVAFVCLSREEDAFLAAVRLHDKRRDLVIVVRLKSQTGLAALLPDLRYMRFVAWDDLVGSPDLIANATVQLLAREFHLTYLANQRAEGKTPQSNPSMVPWHELTDELHDSNRAAAAHVPVKLQRYRCRAEPSDDVGFLFQFQAHEIKYLAEFEHNRWWNWMKRRGWRYGPGPKDPVRKLSPYMISYDKLPEPVKEYDRAQVRDVPRVLAKAGFKICRD